MKWGLAPSWDRGSSTGGNRLINARAETLLNKPSFRELIGRRRCVVPADGFYEWRRVGSRKTPMWIYWKTGEPFVFAALWDSSHDRKLGLLDTFTIITTASNEFMRPIHNRMPVMFDQTTGQQWLDPRSDKPIDLSAMLRPCPSARMAAHEVLPLVNAPENDRIECIQPIPAGYIPPGQLPLL